MQSGDTIVAISSAIGPAARMIIRTSGPKAWESAVALCPDATLEPSSATRATLCMGKLSIPVTLYAFQGPRSYTGEDQIEFHVPGNPLIARLLLAELLAQGLRAAEPGEFTARAYFHNRLDLTEAEGVAATIAAQNDQELRAARQLLSGELAQRLRPAMDLIAQTLALIEVGIDFAEEQVSFLDAVEIADRLSQAEALLRKIVEQSATFEHLSHEPRIVLVGRPNAGKSTLLNVLAGRMRAVVSDIAGTTRDALSAPILLKRGTVRLIDVAGLTEAPDPRTSTPESDIENLMRHRALREIETADLVLLVHDASAKDPPFIPPRPPDMIVFSKSDLVGSPEGFLVTPPALLISAGNGFQLDQLRDRLDELSFGPGRSNFSLALNARHLRAIGESLAALDRAAKLLARESELIALELRDGLDALGEIIGSVTPDDLLGRIFSTFCIGK
jgi:tRNA modification GTPase